MISILNITEKIEIYKNSIREIKEPDKKKSKYQDVWKLEQMVKFIDILEIEKTSKLNKIGELSGDLSCEDQWSNDLYNIRNTYGYMRRNKDETIIEHKPGIDFDKLYRLKVVLDHGQEVGPISTDHLQQLENGLSVLKGKLLQIIKKEKYFIRQQVILEQIEDLELEIVSDSPDIFREICNQYYKKLILKRLHHELQLLDMASYDEVEDRYFVARVLIIIGDLANELFGCYFPQKHDLFIAFKNIFFIRSKIIHRHKYVKEGFKDDIKVTIKSLQIRIGKCIDTRSWEILSENENIKLLLQEAKFLLKFFKERHCIGESSRDSQRASSSEITNDEIMYNLDKLISKASSIINEFGSTSQKLKHLNTKYKSQLNMMNAADRRSYPSNLDADHAESIIRHAMIHLPIKSIGREKSDNHELQRSRKIQENKLKHIINDINNEIEYLKLIETNETIDRMKKKYVMLYIVTVINQFVRDIKESGCDDVTSLHIINPIDLSNQMTTIIDDDLLQTLAIETLYERCSIDYLYTFPEFLSNSISLIALCNVGVSFFKLGFHQRAIEYLESSSNYLNECADKIILAEPLGASSQGITKNRYWFFINRTLANVYHSANRYDEATAKYEQINHEIRCNIADLANCEIRIEIINFFTDFAFHLTDCRQFERAIENFEKIIDFTGDIAIKMKFADALYKHGDFERANNLLDNIWNSYNDDIVPAKVLTSIVSICISGNDAAREIDYAITWAQKFDAIQRDSFGIINAQSTLAKLMIILAKLRIFSNLTELKDEAEKLINILPSEFQRGSLIALIYMSFSWNYACQLGSFHGEKFKMAKEYLYKAKSRVTKMVKPLLNINRKLRAIANYLSLVTNRYCERNAETTESNIRHLQEVIDIEEQFQMNQSSTLQKLALQHKRLANNLDIHYDTRLLSLKKALSLNSKALTQIKKDANNGNVDDREINILKECFVCCHQIAVERHDMKLMMEAVLLYRTFIERSMRAQEMITRYQQMEDCENDIKFFIAFLERLLDSHDVITRIIPNIRMAEFFNHTFDRDLRFEDGVLVRDHLEPIDSIREELHYFRQRIL